MDIKDIDLNLLAVFEALWGEKNVSLAARRIGLSQPAMSAALSRLRGVYKDPLFVRSPQGMVPTHKALSIEKPIREALAIVRTSFQEGEKFEPQDCEKKFQMAMTDWVSLKFLPRLIAILKKKAPSVGVTIYNLTPKQMHDMLLAGDLDLAITGQENYGSGKYQQTLYRAEEYRTIASSQHPKIRNHLSLEDFVAFPHILFSPQGKGLGDVDRALAKKKLKRKIALRIPYALSIPALIENTDFISTVPRSLAETFSSIAKIRVFMPPMSLPTHDLVQYWSQENHTNPAHEWFRSLVAEVFKEFKK